MKVMFAAIVSALSLVGLAETEVDPFATSGGMFRLRGKGKIAVIDCRAQPNAVDYAQGREAAEKSFYLDIINSKGKPFTLANAKEQLKESGANAAVFIADDPSLPMSLAASEESWAMLNAASIRSDNPDAKTFARRLSVLFVRQFCRALGSDECMGKDTAFHVILDVKDIDEVTSLDITMLPEMGIRDTLPRRGLELIEIGSYEDACDMGIAHQPTNDIQRAIWQKAANKKADKADPTNRWKRDFPDKEKPKAK